eukprot:11575554-Alexandrium_andersonii.AAC.1
MRKQQGVRRRQLQAQASPANCQHLSAQLRVLRRRLAIYLAQTGLQDSEESCPGMPLGHTGRPELWQDGGRLHLENDVGIVRVICSSPERPTAVLLSLVRCQPAPRLHYSNRAQLANAA